MKDWEVIATNLSRERWDWGCIVSMDSEGRDIFVVQAHRDGKRFVVRADEKLTAFIELERQVLTVTFYLESHQPLIPRGERSGLSTPIATTKAFHCACR